MTSEDQKYIRSFIPSFSLSRQKRKKRNNTNDTFLINQVSPLR